MKYILLLLFVTNVALAQVNFGEVKHNQINLNVDPYASYQNNGIHINGEFEALLNEVYLKAGYTNFIALTPAYHDFYAGFGTNFKVGYFDDFRIFTGIKAGWIIRQGAPAMYPLLGLEGGLQQRLTDNISIGAKLAYDYRGDTEFWSEELKIQYVLSGHLTLTIKL